MNDEIAAYNEKQPDVERLICDKLASIIDKVLREAESKIWHAHPVWFLDGNPIVGYSKLKGGVRLLFWSGQSFDEPGLQPDGKFKAADARFSSLKEIKVKDLTCWLQKAKDIQWDYKNIVKRKGVLERLK